MKKDGIETVAAIDVGSNSIRMVIAQIKSDGSVEILEELKLKLSMKLVIY